MNILEIMAALEAKHPGEKEYLQAVKEALLSVEEVYNQHPEFESSHHRTLVEPDRIFTFRVTGVDDKGEVQNNIGYRVQFNNAIGPWLKVVSVSTHQLTSQSSNSSASSRHSKCSHHTPDGWWQGWFRLQPPWQERRRNHALLPGVHPRALAQPRS